jgi:hypothetical protein
VPPTGTSRCLVTLPKCSWTQNKVDKFIADIDILFTKFEILIGRVEKQKDDYKLYKFRVGKVRADITDVQLIANLFSSDDENGDWKLFWDNFLGAEINRLTAETQQLDVEETRMKDECDVIITEYESLHDEVEVVLTAFMLEGGIAGWVGEANFVDLNATYLYAKEIFA